MTSRIDTNNTDEILRRRKLRLQQVREQSKHIAKKIRNRAQVEKLQQLEDIDAKKEKQYFECQNKLVKHLQHLYANQLKNVGVGHEKGLEAEQAESVEKIDLSKFRGKEAVAELRKRKQAKLNEQKKLLERKVQAREAANEISREKSATVAKTLTKHKFENLNSDIVNKSKFESGGFKQDEGAEKSGDDVTKNDMGTQWESGELPSEWEPNVPVLLLPKDDSTKDSANENIEKLDKTKRLNLFALSDEMPSSLRGGLTGVTEEIPPIKPSLTLVTEYLQARNLRLRQSHLSPSKKADDLQSIKQTILRSRAPRTNGNAIDNVCHVLDKEVIPVPSWQAELDSGFYGFQHKNCSKYSCNPKLPLNKFSLSPRSLQIPFQPGSVRKGLGICKGTIASYEIYKQQGSKNKSHSIEPDTGLSRKKPITVYDHNTRTLKDIPCDNENLVEREGKPEDNAYSRALKETSAVNTFTNEKLNKTLENMRSKVALTKQSVDKDYADTLAFLNTLPKDKGKPIKISYMDNKQQQMQKEKYQQKLQQEFKKVEKECHKHNCKHSKRKATILQKSGRKSRSPDNAESDGNVNEYSWKPVPESDGSLAIHTIPNTKNKSGNTVTFSKADSYHEYRSRLKHTPPTKDVSNDKQDDIVETFVLEEKRNESDVNMSGSETSSVDNLNPNNDGSGSIQDIRLKHADRIIIYKILKSKKERRSRARKRETLNSPAGDEGVTHNKNNSLNKDNNNEIQNDKTRNLEKSIDDLHRGVSFEQIQEGIYKAVNINGDNITSKYFTEVPQKGDNRSQKNNIEPSCCCNKNKDLQKNDEQSISTSKQTYCNCGNKNIGKSHVSQPSAVTSTTSFTTALNDKTNNVLTESDHIKLIEDKGNADSKFYIGASGFIKDDNYEVVIQLRKKEVETCNNKFENVEKTKHLIIPNKITDVKSQEVELVIPNDPSDVQSDRLITSPLKELEKNLSKSSDQILNKGQIENVLPVESSSSFPLSDKCEKAVLTSFQDSFAIPAHVSKSDPIARPATSTFTQTSFNSSMPRPPFMHMSSSTSTAYMSPPELILPTFLRQNYIITSEEMYESENTMNQLDPQYEAIENDDYKKKRNCKCSRCIDKAVGNKNIRKKYPLNTPPNTARSLSQEKSFDEYRNEKNCKCKCRKAKSRSDTNICHKSHRKRSHSTLKTRSSKEMASHSSHPPLTHSVKNKNLNICLNSKGHANKLNPLVKYYVNRLLALNSEGLKAIEIINQDCSAASTPGSSIINLPCNKDKSSLETKISLEQIKNLLKEQILNNNLTQTRNSKQTDVNNIESQTVRTPKSFAKFPKKKSVHKVKSLNISKHIYKKNKTSSLVSSMQRFKKPSASTSTKNDKNNLRTERQGTKSVIKTSTKTPFNNLEYKNNTSSDAVQTESVKSNHFSSKSTDMLLNNKPFKRYDSKKCQQTDRFNLPLHRATATSISSDSETTDTITRHLNTPDSPINTSTQTNRMIDAEINFMKLAENKLQNMEKIADLTEKCTQRLSNLAKVLEEVRKNKSLAYSQISTSDSTSGSEPKSEKNDISQEISKHVCDPTIIEKKDTGQICSSLSMSDEINNVCPKDTLQFTQILKDIPKPKIVTEPPNTLYSDEISNGKPNLLIELENTKIKSRPPSALSRIHLKYGKDILITPHELSTVIEVDSPMSLKLKNKSSRLEMSEKSNSHQVLIEKDKKNSSADEMDSKLNQPRSFKENPDLLKSNINLLRKKSKISSADSSDDSKMQMMDLKQFNDIMLKPFISVHDYAKQCNVGLDEGSNLDDVIRDEPFNDDLSSLHSDGSLPDVIAELLKRKIISEPFKFDTGSNANSTTLSSESTLSVLTLSKAPKEKKKFRLPLNNKENVETSETLSISSNPDLENAFQKLGMGWASSTLKKTKERLALSSSSNTSSSSMTKFKIKSFSHDLPNLDTDSISSLVEVSKRERKKSGNIGETSKHAVQQTLLTNSMTVKEFLTNELAKKITFNNKSSRRENEEEYVSLYETKMPDMMKHSDAEREDDTIVSGNNRARTSTPVQIFRSKTYHSSSTSNTSNGLFSNADDLSSVKVTSTSVRNHSTSDKDELTIPNYTLKTKKDVSDCSKSD